MLAAMDVFALASMKGEGLPQALTRAMAMERPVVATATGSVPEVVKHGVTGAAHRSQGRRMPCRKCEPIDAGQNAA